MSLVKEFKAFAMQDNILDLAVGIVIGMAFGRIVSSFVGDILMPPLGLLFRDVNFADLAVVLQPATETRAAISLNYGKFIQTVVDFLIIAFAIFLVLKALQGANKEQSAAPKAITASNEEVILTEIRDLLKQRFSA